MIYSDAVLADSPVAYWKFDETSGSLVDHSGNGRTGTITGSVTRGVEGPNEQATAIRFGGNAYVNTLPAPAVPSLTWSFETWINAEDASTHHSLVSGTSGDFDVYIVASQRYSYFWNGSVSLASYANIINFGQWQHYVITCDASVGARIYIDGVLKASDSATRTLPVSINKLAANRANQYYLTGAMTETAVYDYALTLSQIKAHGRAMFHGSAPPPPPWNFPEIEEPVQLPMLTSAVGGRFEGKKVLMGYYGPHMVFDWREISEGLFFWDDEQLTWDTEDIVWE